MSGVECFLIAPSNHAKVELRRYRNGDLRQDDCPASGYGYHNASIEFGDCAAWINDEGILENDAPSLSDHSDPRWPRRCACGYEFAEDDHWQVSTSTWWVDASGREMLLNEAPAGALFDAFWLRGWGSVNGSGPAWSVVCPGGSPDSRTRVWHIGSEATNCTRKGEDHDCWCCHGEAPRLTVDKQPEPGRSTCAAGAGSILIGDWHGFLRDGQLVT